MSLCSFLCLTLGLPAWVWPCPLLPSQAPSKNQEKAGRNSCFIEMLVFYKKNQKTVVLTEAFIKQEPNCPGIDKNTGLISARAFRLKVLDMRWEGTCEYLHVFYNTLDVIIRAKFATYWFCWKLIKFAEVFAGMACLCAVLMRSALFANLTTAVFLFSQSGRGL